MLCFMLHIFNYDLLFVLKNKNNICGMDVEHFSRVGIL